MSRCAPGAYRSVVTHAAVNSPATGRAQRPSGRLPDRTPATAGCRPVRPSPADAGRTEVPESRSDRSSNRPRSARSVDMPEPTAARALLGNHFRATARTGGRIPFGHQAVARRLAQQTAGGTHGDTAGGTHAHGCGGGGGGTGGCQWPGRTCQCGGGGGGGGQWSCRWPQPGLPRFPVTTGRPVPPTGSAAATSDTGPIAANPNAPATAVATQNLFPFTINSQVPQQISLSDPEPILPMPPSSSRQPERPADDRRPAGKRPR